MAVERVRLGILAAALVVILLPSTGRAQAIQRSLYVSLLNDAGAPVVSASPSDFVVREDNVAREVLRVVPADEPMQIAVLVDNSQAAREYVQDLRSGLRDFVTAMTAPGEAGRRNEMAIIAFADRPTILADYTPNRAQLIDKGTDRIFAQPQSGAYLLDAIIEVSRGFKKRDAKRPVIVALTTEGPEFSNRLYDQVLGPLADSGAAFHAIVIGPLARDVSDETRNRGMVLDQGTRDSGGRRDNLLTSMALGVTLKELANELTHQYRVTYARPQSLIPPEHVTVSAAKGGMTARGTLIKDQTKP